MRMTARISQILRNARRATDAWDNSGAVSGPYLVPDGPHYLGRSADGARQGIGVAESDDPEWRE